MNDLENQLPRIFQSNLNRFYQRVIAPALENLPEPVLREVVPTSSMSVYAASRMRAQRLPYN